MPKVSVIIPSYNNAKLILDAIGSVLGQTFKDYEIVVIDSSTDNTREVLSKYVKKIRFFYYQEQKCVSAARNLGIREAQGEYIAFLDADDMWLPSYLRSVIDIFEKDKKAALVYTNLNVLQKSEIVGSKPNRPAFTATDFWQGARIVTSAVTVRKECFSTVGLFDENLKIAEDIDMWVRIITSGFKIRYVPRNLSVYRLDNPDSLTKNPIRVFKNLINFHKKYLSAVKTSVPQSLIKRELARQHYLLGKEYFRGRNYIDASKNICRAIIVNPLLGFTFINRSDGILSKCLKPIKPYLALPYCIFRLIFKNKDGYASKMKGEINILYFESSSGFGGSANALVSLINHLDNETFYPILGIHNLGPQLNMIKDIERIKLEDYQEPDKLPHVMLFFSFIRKIIPEAIRIYIVIKKRRISLTHINTNIMSGMSAIIASKLAGVPCVCHIRQTRRLIRREKFFAKWVNIAIILNKNAFELCKQDIPQDKLKIIYDSVDFNTISNIQYGFKEEFNLDSSPVVGLVGRIVKGKGQKEFILSAKEVLKTKPDVKFVIVGAAKGGDDRYYKEAKELVKKENLEKNIIFTGWRNDVKDIISELDILVQGSTTFPEGFGLTIIEAMALRKPVIATDIPGPQDIIVDGETGFLVPPGDAKVMAEKIICLLDNPEAAKKMGEKGRKRAKELFDIKKNIIEIENIYKRLM